MDSWAAPNAEYAPPKPGEPALHRAARVGDGNSVRELILQGADINEVFDLGLDPGARPVPATPLMVAAGSGDGASIETVDLLLELGADPTLVLDDYTAASFAISGLGWNYPPGGDVVRLRRLLNAGSTLPPDRTQAHRLLHQAAAANDVEQLRVLLDHGLSAMGFWDIEEIRAANRSALRAITDSSFADAFKAMMPEGMDMDEEFMSQMQNLDEEMSGIRQERPYSFQIPIFGAVQSGSLECLDLLLKHGADVTVRDSLNQTAMYYASSVKMVRALMAAGVPLEDKDQFDCSPLVAALSDCDAEKVRALLAAGADMNATHDHGYTVLMSAVGSSERNLEVLQVLIAAGADPHAVSEYGYNAFHAAIDVNGGEANAEESVREVFGYLKELGVDIEGRTQGGQTPLSRAISEGTATEVRILCELGANTNSVCELRNCDDQACTETALPMIFHGVRGSGVDKDQKTASLLAFGADPQTVDADGHRPLHYAVADLCADSDSSENSYMEFFAGLNEFQTIKASLPPEHGAFVEASTAWFQRYVERFATDIPLSDSIYAEEFRCELVACIASLCGYESWLTRG